MNNVKKAAALLLALALIFAFPVTASAAETTEARVPVTLTVVNTVSPISCIGFICRFLQFQVKSRPHTCRSHVHWQSRKLNPCLSIAWNWQTEPLGFLKLLSICFR